MWNIIIDKDLNYPIDVTFNGLEVNYVPVSDDVIEVNCNDWPEFINQANSDFPSNIEISISMDLTELNTICSILYVRREKNEKYTRLLCMYPNVNWSSKWNGSLLVGNMAEQAVYTNLLLEDYDAQPKYNEDPYIIYNRNLKASETIEDQLLLALKEVNSAASQSEIALGNLVWKKEYEINEKLFSIEVVFPLLRRMGFLSVRYNHGSKEYGKDFVFSEITKFNVVINNAIQVKAGNINGGVKSQIDEIIGQLEDAFSLPYRELGSEGNKYISNFYVIISGLFTENAKEKIIYKIPKELKGSIFFIDRYKILELIDKYWNNYSDLYEHSMKL
ncbi:restriction endonuclease [Paenibacillus brasilensis]|uniref:Restriction endonuclease type IV Mrr domain-containing protein n=1 Tax=Paenibacillus brasilensis TaxID=128574 RepID=A0ABU0L657_9BACL|nr:restriction endonuclease [Paenibacillus brasilensis]MDQ0496787.1 hypothetical protein [Paenibacillus brasilensis]